MTAVDFRAKTYTSAYAPFVRKYRTLAENGTFMFILYIFLKNIYSPSELKDSIIGRGQADARGSKMGNCYWRSSQKLTCGVGHWSDPSGGGPLGSQTECLDKWFVFDGGKKVNVSPVYWNSPRATSGTKPPEYYEADVRIKNTCYYGCTCIFGI